MRPPDFRFHTRDPDEATERLSDVSNHTRLHAADCGAFSANAIVHALPGIGLFEISLAHGRVENRRFEHLSLTLPRSSGLEIRNRRGRWERFGPGRLHVTEPEHRLDLRDIRPGATLVANLDLALVGPHLEACSSAAASHPLPEAVDLGQGAGLSLRRSLETIWDELGPARSSYRAPLIAAEAAQTIAAMVAHTLDGATGNTGAEERCAERTTLRRAEEYLASRLSSPVSLAELARASATSTRSLARAFQRHRGMGPIAFLRERRFDAAQWSLAHASPASSSVTDIALHYGFAHLGRFSIGYRQRFGESPRQTLARERLHA